MYSKNNMQNSVPVLYFDSYWAESENGSANSLLDTNAEVSNLEKSAKHEKPRILFVEDDQVVQEIYYKFFLRLNCECTVASNAKQALNHLQGMDLMFLDIGLPQMDGITLCRLIREELKGHPVPIIALTGYGDFVKEECCAAGFDQVVAKPILLDDLYALLLNWLPEYKTVLKKPERPAVV